MSTHATTAAHATASRHSRALAMVAVMTSSMMQTVDTTIVNVALPQMQGQLGATTDEISWVLTSYIVASAIFMPLAGYFIDRIGQRMCLVAATGGFVLTSLACGLAQNVDQLVLYRLLQGVAGAALQPLSQTIVMGIYPIEQRGRAMALAGIGTMLGPVLGPSLGGWLVQTADWRWTFFINLPIGAIAIACAWWHVPDTPARPRGMDWLGFAWIALAVGGLQYALDRGNHLDWFESGEIRLAAALAVAGVAAFAVHAARSRGTLVFSPRIFLNRNYTIACLASPLLNFGMMGGMVMNAFLLQTLIGYTPDHAGNLMAPRGLALIVGMLAVGRTAARIDPRASMTFGVVVFAFGQFMMTRLTPDADAWAFILPGVVQGFAAAFAMVGTSVAAYSTLGRDQYADASGIFSLVRSAGGSIGVAVTVALSTRHTQVAWQHLGAEVTAVNPRVDEYVSALHMQGTDPTAIALMANEVGRQALMWSLIDAYMLVTITSVVVVPLLVAFKLAPPRPAGAH
ncbi:MAG: DHA2 family efflux MFS transporter permease subunit [Gammaproteobacteria bacterium]